MALIKCPECGKKISDSSDKCVNCGKTITDVDREKALHNAKKRKKRNKIISLVVLIIIALCIGIAIFLFEKSKKDARIAEEKRIEEQKRKEEERAEQKRKKEEEKKKNERNFKKSAKNLIIASSDLSSYLQKKSVLIAHVWSNAIYETRAKETNKYTLKKSGKFKEFSDAVNDCVMAEIYANKKADKLYLKFKNKKLEYQAVTLDEDLKKKYEDQKICIDQYVDNVQSYYNALSSPSGNYNDFTSNINNLEYELSDNVTDIASKCMNFLF